jgi:hypothetical protein
VFRLPSPFPLRSLISVSDPDTSVFFSHSRREAIED